MPWAAYGRSWRSGRRRSTGRPSPNCGSRSPTPASPTSPCRAAPRPPSWWRAPRRPPDAPPPPGRTSCSCSPPSASAPSATSPASGTRATSGSRPPTGSPPCAPPTPPSRTGEGARPLGHRAPIRFEDVHFTHPGAGRPALDGITFTAPAGRTTAIVGPSGAGKSTLLSLLLRQRDPDSGRVTIGGTETAAYTLASLRRGIAVVSQETYLFHATIAENLRVARPAATDQQLRGAARAAGIDQEITAFPQGYDTLVGERGATLSGGQRQRLALARALLADTPVLILDEATSAVDERGEARIVRELLAASRGRTCLVVAHRLDAVRHADHIVVLDGGRVEASGDHSGLLADGGVYASLVAAGRTAQEEHAA